MEKPWVVTGRVATVVHAHPLEEGRGDDAVYLDADAGGQLVVYLRGDKPREGAWIEASGRPLDFEASPKRGGRAVQVRQLDASSWRPLRGREALERLVRDLGGPDPRLGEAPAAERAALKARILEGGFDAFPVLIAHLGDARVHKKGPGVLHVTVGQVCAGLLRRLLTPPYRSPHERAVKPRGEMLLVRDWPAWWRRNHGRSLADVHRGLEPLVDRYFLTGGDTQIVDGAAAP